MNKEATTGGSTGKTGSVSVPDNVCLVASRFFFEYDEKYGEFRKRIHPDNPRYGELASIVDEPAAEPDGERDHHGRILEACDVYDKEFNPKGHTLVTVCGGYNGGGAHYKWCEYLREISDSIRRLVGKFGFAWLVDLHEHSDVWYATIGFEDRRGFKSGDLAGDGRSQTEADDFSRYSAYREKALSERRPLGLVDWGHHGYDWAWSKLGGPYPHPKTAFDWSLISPQAVAGHYAAYDCSAGCFRDALGVYEARNGSQAFYVVASSEHDGFESLYGLAKDRFREFEKLPLSAFRLVEGWTSDQQTSDGAGR